MRGFWVMLKKELRMFFVSPVAYVVRRDGAHDSEDDIRSWFNQQVGKTQRLSGLRLTDELPRSAIGKVLKRELRDAWR